jgi:hypothetical protein
MTPPEPAEIETTATAHGSRRRVTLVRHGVFSAGGVVTDDHRTTAGKTPRDWSAWFRRLAWLTENPPSDVPPSTSSASEVEYR